MDVLNARRDVLAPRGDGEMVVVEAREQILLERLAQEIRHVAQELVALREPVALVETLKVLDIEIHECQRFRQLVLYVDGCVPHKLHHVEESRNLTEITLSVLFQQNEPPISSR